ncbi:ATP-dependent DNA helicase, partial [Pseudomonas syringae]|uniref:ATP-dependent DNA helicase n=1 Tax=Pseudomonas syringae TaxID=317 RepID=UPI001FEDFFA6
HSEIAQTQLTEVKRQSKASEMPSAAQAIREGRWPDFTSNEAGEVILLPTSDAEIIPTVLRLYEQKREGTQILCATRSCRFAGVDALNRTCHVRYASHGRPLLAFSAESGQIESTGFCVGDLLLYTANDWQRDLQNGCLGQLTEVYDDVVQVNIGTVDHPIMRGALGCAVYEGIHHYVLESDLDAMQHAYAITVHKSQGSQFQRVIIPVRQSRILDRTFVYTALTRAQVQVILVGDASYCIAP